MEDRDNLPFRKNCEGYFVSEGGKILARDSGKGFIIFPGGGVDETEDVEKAMIRETKEETCLVPSDLKKIGVLKILWGPDWAKTDKQKDRYGKFQGDEMHFFSGVAGEGCEDFGKEDFWKGEKFMNVNEVIDLIDKSRPFEEDIEDYREKQLECLRKLIRDMGL